MELKFNRLQNDSDVQSNCDNPENDPRATDFKFVRFIGKNVYDIILRFWAQSGAALLTFILFFWIYGGLLAFAFVCFAITGLLYHAADQLVFHPNQPHHSRIFVPSPRSLGLNFENLFIQSSDNIKLNCVLIKRRNESSHLSDPTIIYFHGNAGNIGHRLANAKGLHVELKANIFLVEYRGYGHSEGSVSEKGMYKDAKAALNYLLQRKDICHDKIIIFGRSLGGAVAIDLASDEYLSKYLFCLIVENTFTCIPEVAVSLFKWKVLKRIPIWCYKNKFNSIKRVNHLKVPVLFISGLADTLIPPKMMQDLYDTCSSNIKDIVTFKSGSHNETWRCVNYYKAIRMFLSKIHAERHVLNEVKSGVIHNDLKLSASNIQII